MGDRRRVREVRLQDYVRPRLASAPPPLVRALWYGVNYGVLNSAWPWPSGLRAAALRLFGARIGRGVVIKPRVRVKSPWALTIGDHAWIGEDCWIDNHGRVEIGRSACLSQGVYVGTGSHDYEDERFAFFARPVTVGDEAWICLRATLLPGARVGRLAVVGPGVVVSGETPERAILKPCFNYVDAPGC